MSNYSTTKARIFQWIGIVLILAVFAGAYWYFKVYGSTLNQSQNDLNTNGLVGLWSFNGDDMSGTTAYDRSGSGNNGTLTNGPTVTTGKVGQALNFDGSDDYVAIGNVAALKNSVFTYSAWIKPVSLPAERCIFGGESSIARFSVTSTGALSMTNTGVATIGTSTGTVSTGVWSHVVATYDASGSYIFYINGSNVGSGTNLQSFTFSGADFKITGCSGTYFPGSIDDVRIYNRAITASEVTSLYVQGSGTKSNTSISQPQGTGRLDSGLTGYWPLDENTGTNAADSSTNGTAGTLTNGPTWTTGQIGSAVTFDGTNDYISVGTGTVGIPAGSKGLTLSSFVNVTTFQSYTVMIGKSHTSTYGGWQLNTNADSGNRFGGGVNVSGAWTAITSANTYSTGVWYHVSMTYDGVTMRLYVNGVLDTTVAAAGSIQYATNEAAEVNIGRNPATDVGSRYLTGSLDEVRVYNRTLSEDEISQLYRLTTPTSVDTGLKGYWSFNAQDMASTTAYDRSGAGNTGTLTGGPTVTPGKVGQALSFDGSNDYVNVTHTSPLNAYPLSVSVWFKTNTTSGTDGIVNKYLSSSQNGWNIFFYSGTLCAWYFRAAGSDVYAGGSCTLDVTGVNDNQWHQAVFVVDASGGSMFVDGTLRATEAWAGTPGAATTTQDLRIGHYPSGTDYFSGAIDEVRVYNRALSAGEIQSLYAQGGGTKTNTAVSQPQGTGRLDSGLAGYWKMDENTGTSATDSSTNGNTGTLTNGPTWTTGQIGSAVDFDGTDDYIEIGSNIKVDNSDRGTIATWIKWDSFPVADRSIFSFGGGTVASAGRLYLYLDFSNSKLTIRQNSDGETADTVQGSTVFVTGTWYHVAAVSNGSSVSLYVNGAQESLTVSSGTNTGDWFADTTVTGTQRSLWGRQYVNGSLAANPLNGQLDEAYIYNRALSADEVAQLYRLNTPTGTDTGLKGYWSFNGQDVSGTTAYDRSGVGNTGTLTNGPTKTIGKLGQALSFDGTNDYVESVANSTALANLTQGSFAFWIKPRGASYQNAIFSSMVSDGGDNGPFTSGFVISGDSWTGTQTIRFAVDGSTGDMMTRSTTALSLNTWNHVVVVWDGTLTAANTKFYLNGVLDTTTATQNGSGVYVASDGRFRIGKYASASLYLNAILDELRIYNRQLSAAEVAALYNSSR